MLAVLHFTGVIGAILLEYTIFQYYYTVIGAIGFVAGDFRQILYAFECIKFCMLKNRSKYLFSDLGEHESAARLHILAKLISKADI